MTLPRGDNRAIYANQRSLELLIDGAAWTLATWGHFFVALILAFILAQEFGWLATGGWAAALCATVSWQAWFARRLQTQETLEPHSVSRSLHRFTLSALCVGMLWAVAAGLLFPVEVAELRWFLLFIIGGMSLAAVGTQHVYLPACYASMSIALPFLALRYALVGAWLEALLLLLYLAVIIRLARMLNRFSAQTARLQQDRDELLDELLKRADELETARETAEQANIAKSRFLAQASHDLRQPLHAIGLFVETIAENAEPERVERVVGRVRSSLDALSKLFESLLDVSMLDTGQIKVTREPVALSTLFERMRREFEGYAAESGVTLRFARTDITLLTDESLLNRLTLNLVSNAIRYSPGGRVLVGARWTDSGIAIEVRDNGAGIVAAEQERIFEEFVRLEDKSASAQGLGLGLAIVSRSARLLDATVTLQSQPGAGSVFRVGPFPLSTTPAEQNLDDTPVELSDLLVGLRILLIDDDPESLDSMSELLESWRCCVTARSQPENLHELDWDVVISDYELGDDRFGDAVVEQLRRRLPDLPAVLVSGSTAPELQKRARTAKLPLLRKPVRPAQLRSALLHVIVQNTA